MFMPIWMNSGLMEQIARILPVVVMVDTPESRQLSTGKDL